MMKKRILKVIGLLGVCGILEITTPAVTFAETSTTDTSGMSDEEVYEKALEYAKKVYKYDKAAELLRTIEGYKDSTELADRYEVMSSNRYIGGRFYWYPAEYALMIKQNIFIFRNQRIHQLWLRIVKLTIEHSCLLIFAINIFLKKKMFIAEVMS